MMKDPYQVLGVQKNCAQDEIKKSYRQLAKKYHPDLNPNNKQAEDKFKEITAAFEILGDEKRRRLFDEFGPDSLRTGFDPEKAREYQRWSSGQGFSSAGASGAGAGANPFEQFGGFEDIFEQFFFGGKKRSAKRQTTKESPSQLDVESEIQVSFLAAIRGDEVEISLPWMNHKNLKVRIPKGVRDGEKIRLANQGQTSSLGTRGHLYLKVNIAAHPFLKREGEDLYMDVPVTLKEVVLSETIEIPTPYGSVKLKIPLHCQGGEKLRLKGKGVQRSNQEPGDMFVILQIKAPDKNRVSLSLLDELSKSYDLVRANLKIE